MWHKHILPFREWSFGSINILVTWPYHRTFRYFTLDPAARLLADFEANVDDLTGSINHWHIAKEMECEFVRKASTVAAAANIGIFSWTNIHNTYWLAKAMFYFSLSLSLWGVITSAQQTSVVRTLWARQNDQHQLRLKARVILRCPEQSYHRKQRRKTFAELNMLYVWQCPLMLMSYGWATLLIGITLHVCSPLIPHGGDHERKVAIFYLATGVSLLLNFIWTSAWVCWTPPMSNDLEREAFQNSVVNISVPSTRSGTTWVTEVGSGIEGREKFQLLQPRTL